MSPRQCLRAAAAALLLLPCALAARADTVRSPVIYPKSNAALIFSHPRHADVGCDSCHKGVRRSASAGDRNLPREERCRPCHDKTRKKLENRRGPPARCGTCHRSYGGGRPPTRLSYPAARLRFGHRLHLDRGVACGACHVFGGKKAVRPLPAMATCRSCHQRRGVSTRCVVCHLSRKDGRLRTSFPGGTLRPRGSLKGAAHTRRFRIKHAAVARSNRKYCATCHQKKSCLRCHGGSLRPMSIHGGNYVIRHSVDARRKTTRCQSCHRTQTFCLGCHQRTGVGTETRGSGFRPGTGKRFHSKAFVALGGGPGHHSLSARRNIGTCVSCHREKTCIRCHGTRSMNRGGFSPHRSGFRRSRKCKALTASNQRVCLKCHLPGSRRLDCR